MGFRLYTKMNKQSWKCRLWIFCCCSVIFLCMTDVSNQNTKKRSKETSSKASQALMIPHSCMLYSESSKILLWIVSSSCLNIPKSSSGSDCSSHLFCSNCVSLNQWTSTPFFLSLHQNIFSKPEMGLCVNFGQQLKISHGCHHCSIFLIF